MPGRDEYDPAGMPPDPLDPDDRKFTKAVEHRVQFATLNQVERLTEQVAESVRLGRANHEHLERIEGWLVGTVTAEGSPKQGLIHKVDVLFTYRRMFLGMVGVMATSAAGSFAVAVIHLVTGK